MNDLRVLSWNLYHGRDHPPDPALLSWRSRLLRLTERNATHAQVNRSLEAEFGSWIAAQDWDLALLQEAPPRWFRALARRSRASGALALTSRNLLPCVQRVLADWNPDLIASSEGGSNQLLVRRARLAEVRRLTLTRRPERRRMLWARLELGSSALCVGNLHASAGLPEKATNELLEAAERASEWSAGAPLILGGDFNLRPRRQPAPFEVLRRDLGLGEPTAPDAIDHLLVRGLEVLEAPRRLAAEEREVAGPDGLSLRLSDHAPVIARFGMR